MLPIVNHDFIKIKTIFKNSSISHVFYLLVLISNEKYIKKLLASRICLGQKLVNEYGLSKSNLLGLVYNGR
jgi:hypothetical protein